MYTYYKLNVEGVFTLENLKNRKLLISIGIALVIAIVLFTTYFIVTNNPTFRVKATISYMIGSASELLEKSDNSQFTNAFLNGRTEIKTDITAKLSFADGLKKKLSVPLDKIEKFVNSSLISTEIKTDIKDEYVNVNLDYVYNNDKISIETYTSDLDTYLRAKEYYDNFIKIGSISQKYSDVISSQITNDELSYIVDIIKKSIVDSIEDKNIKKTDDIIEIDEERIDVNKFIFEIDNAYINRMQIKLLEIIKTDEKACKIMYKLDKNNYPDVNEFNKSLDLRIKKLNDEVDEKDIVVAEYVVYTKGVFNETLRQELKMKDSKEFAFQYITYKCSKFDENISIYKDNEIILESNIKKHSKDVYDISTKIGSDISFDIKGKINNSNLDLEYVIRTSGLDDIKGSLKSNSNIVNNKEMKNDFDFKINTPETYGTLELTAKTYFKVVDNISKVSFKDSVPVNNITNEEMINILEKFESKNNKILKDLNDIILSFN